MHVLSSIYHVLQGLNKYKVDVAMLFEQLFIVSYAS